MLIRWFKKIELLFSRFKELGLPLKSTFVSFLRFHFKYAFTVQDFFRYRLYDPGVATDKKLEYLPGGLSSHIWSLLNPPWYAPALTNKYIFHCIAESSGLAVPKLYGIFDPESGFTFRGSSLKTLGELSQVIKEQSLDALILKPVEGMQAKFVFALSRADGAFEDLHRGRLSLEEIFNQVTDTGNLKAQLFKPGISLNYTSFLLQERLSQHPDLLKLAGPMLSPIRILTLVGIDGNVEIISARLHLLDHRTAKDANDSSAIDCMVDIGSGVISEGVKTKGGGFVTGLTQAPAGQLPFAGAVCPLWEEAKDLAMKAAQRYSFCRAIGWDVAITSKGALLLEGNTQWGFTSLQTSMGRGLYRGEFKRVYKSLVASGGKRYSKTLPLT